jgi:Tfp pilus assembly protein FimV
VPKWAKALPNVYGPVKEGETLYRVVENLGVPRSFTWQVAVRLWRDNPDRFFAGNIHGLLTGLYLRLPKQQEWQTVMTSMSLEEAQHIVDEQWGAWRKLRRAALEQPKQETQTVLSNPTPVQTVQMESQPVEEEEAAASMVLSTQEPSAMVTVNELQSVLRGLEERLAQRLSVPSTTPNEVSDESVSFVSAAELQVALRGLEGRLSEQLQRVATQQKQAAQAAARVVPRTITPAVPHGAGVETFLGLLFSTDTVLYVLIIQNVILFTLACGFAWRWYTNRV